MTLHVEPITGAVHLVSGEQNGKFPQSFSFLIRDKKTVLIDTGCGLDTLRELRRRFPVDEVIHSHTHPDHMPCSRLFADVPVWYPAEAPPTIHDFDALAERFVGRDRAHAWQDMVRRDMGFEPPKDHHLRFRDGHVFDLGRTQLQAVYTPGHCVDHYSFWIQRDGVLFLSDIDLSGFGPWYGHPECNLESFRRSIQRVRSLDAAWLLSSHKKPLSSRCGEALDRYEQALERQRRTVLTHLETPATLEELVNRSPFYGHTFSVPLVQRAFEESIIRHLLAELSRDGWVETLPGDPVRFRRTPTAAVEASRKLHHG